MVGLVGLGSWAARALTVGGLFVLLAACAASDDGAPQSGDVGLYPDNYQALIQDYMRPMLHDPSSAVYGNWRGPVPRAVGGLLSARQQGYAVCVDMVARSKHGSYAPARRFYFLIRDGAVVSFVDNDYDAQQLCRF